MDWQHNYEKKNFQVIPPNIRQSLLEAHCEKLMRQLLTHSQG
jgi:hypothetical protein